MRAILPKIKRCWIDKDLCTSQFLCCKEAPNSLEEIPGDEFPRFRTDDPVVLNQDAANIFDAAAVCPMYAVKIELEDGTIIDDHPDRA